MNRVKSGKYARTVCGVVGQPNQFAPGALSKPMTDKRSRARAEKIAGEVLAGKRHRGVGKAMFFHTAGRTYRFENMELLHNDLSIHNVTTVKNFASELPPVLGSRGQLRELLLNLIQNAIEAMAATTNRPRIITVATERLDSDAIRISLQDTGPGIDPRKLPTIFDLFVTTKPKGTGLGLGICKMVVDRHRGKLSAASDAGAGARFEITLPTK